METLLDRLLDNIAMEFHIGDRENIDIKSKIGEGFSGAEIYLVELKGASTIRGYYYLKIDSEADEYENNLNGFCFSKVAQCIEKRIISGYYVLLIQIAGMSKLEYQSFYSIYKASVKVEAAKKITSEILKESTNGRDIANGELAPADFFREQLKNKLDSKGILVGFLGRHLYGGAVKDICAIQINEDVLPNAFAYAVNDALWDGKKILNMACSIHGDFHGNNVFVSNNTHDYAIIDMDSYRDDGYIFFDTAYFEYSLMYHDMGKESLDNWLYCVSKVVEQAWDEIDFKDSKVIQTINQEEEEWIEKKIAEKFSYLDELRKARLMARVLVGLNYSGKRNLPEEGRLKAYMYACCYLKRLLQEEGINYISGKICVWKNDSGSEAEQKEYNAFLDFAGRFDNSQNYYLVLGRQWDYSNIVSLNLRKIRLSGVVSFCREKGFSDILEKTQLLNYVLPNNEATWGHLEKDSAWWLYADGMVADPESQAEKYSKWRIKYRKFLERFSDKLIKAAGENDLLFIIDWTNFNDEDNNYLQRLLEQLDAIENTAVNIAVLDPKNSFNISAEDYGNLEMSKFKIRLEDVAEYCSLYMSDEPDEVIYIPNRSSRIGIPLSKSDQQYIERHTVFLYEQMIRGENILAESEKYKFFYGEPITWTAIEEELYVKHKRIKSYEEEVRKKLENANDDQILISIQHSPGAGASVLGRIICWNLKKEYPTFILQNEITDDVYESLRRVAAISGKHLLVFMDGDYNRNDVNQFIYHLGGMRIKVCILYSCRIYSIKEGDNRIISVLEAREGELFRDKYESVMREWKNYDETECKKRVENMEKLTTENSMVEFRLPFFYGMHAFEDEYQGIQEYLDGVQQFMKQNENIEKVILYIALISYYTETKGLGFKCTRKLLKMKERSGRKILKELQENFPKIIYIVDSSYRICHPIVAKNILHMKFQDFCSDSYKEFCIHFIEDLRKSESSECMSDRYLNLIMDMFIKRDTEEEIDGNDTKKKSFSQIILDIGNPNLQEQVYESLVKAVPSNASFRQHYGRLIMSNNPARLKDAKGQLEKAIDIEPDNGSLYHSRGNLYVQYVFHQMNNDYKDVNASELFNKLRHYVDLAVTDFEYAVKLEEKEDNASDLVYPYASIIQVSTSFVHQLARRSKFSDNEKGFLEQVGEMNQWSRNLVAKALLYDMDTEIRYSPVRDNVFYDKTRRHLFRFKWSPQELETKIKKYPNTFDYQIAYLDVAVSDKNSWKQKSQQQLRQIIACCENLFKIDGYGTEGILWKWFNASIRIKRPVDESFNRILGFLETLPEQDINPTANYFRLIIYFCKYMETKDEKMVDSICGCINRCKQLVKDGKNRSITHYYYMDKSAKGENMLPLEFDRENAHWFEGTVVSADSNQSGYLTLDINPKLRAFFVPIHTELKRNQEIGQQVKVKIGFRFDGLSGWELKQ